MPRSRLVWLQIADQQYHDLPEDLRGLVDRRIAALLENPTVDPDAVYNDRSDQWSVPLGERGFNDAEELATMASWVQRARPRLERQLPWVPAGAWKRISVSREHSAVAIGLMGCLVAAAAARGARTGGRSPLFQAVLTGFGVHAVPHLASAVLTRGYTPGVVTAPTIVAPFSWWAWRQLRAAGVPVSPISPASLALLPLSVATAHAGATLLLWARECGHAQQASEPSQ